MILTFHVIGQSGEIAPLHLERVTIADDYGNDYEGVVVDGEIQIDASTGLTYGTDVVIEHFALHPVYPNPFNSTTTLSFDIPTTSPVQISVYNILGHHISDLVNTTLTQGRYSMTIDAHSWATGTYLITLKSTDFHQIRKMLLLK